MRLAKAVSPIVLNMSFTPSASRCAPLQPRAGIGERRIAIDSKSLEEKVVALGVLAGLILDLGERD